MVRTVLAVVIGVILGVVVISITESIGHIIFPPPEGVDLKDPEALSAIMDTIPVGAKMSVLIAWGLGIFAGGIAAMKISQGQNLTAWIVAGILFAFAVMTMFAIPHPVWMMIGSVVATLVGCLGAIKLTSR